MRAIEDNCSTLVDYTRRLLVPLTKRVNAYKSDYAAQYPERVNLMSKRWTEMNDHFLQVARKPLAG